MSMISRRKFIQTAGAAAVAGTAVASGAVSASACFGTSDASSASQTVVITGFDWGPDVTATIIQLDSAVRASSVKASAFTVSESKENFDWVTFSPSHIITTAIREVTDAYTCTAAGKRTELPSKYIRLDLAYDPNTGAPFCYDMYTGKNTWCDPYELTVTLNEGAALTTVTGGEITSIEADPAIDFSQAIISQLDSFKLDGSLTGTDGKTLCYAYYKPMTLSSKKLPLVIWLHGAGEGGADPRILLLGNKVTPLAEDEFQSAMGGAAYILTPQAPGFWLEYDEAGNWQDNPGVPSVYTQTLKELIDSFVAEHSQVDPNRIIIGGCSNGGYMTVNMILRYPDYFAAAYPICEAYANAGITDAELAAIKDVPTWFVYAENDTTVDPTIYEAPTLARLRDMGANVHTSIFADVHDTSGVYKNDDGTPYQYMGHWSWLYFFNNECVEDSTGENLWTWLGQQSK